MYVLVRFIEGPLAGQERKLPKNMDTYKAVEEVGLKSSGVGTVNESNITMKTIIYKVHQFYFPHDHIEYFAAPEGIDLHTAMMNMWNTYSSTRRTS